MLHSDDCFIQNKNVAPTEIDDELLMISEDEEHFISLNATGKTIFYLLSTPKSLDEVVQALVLHFKVDETNCKKDVDSFLSSLLKHRVIVVCERKGA